MKRPSTAKQLSIALKKELRELELTTVRRVYIAEKIKLIEEFVINKSKCF